MLPGSWKRAEEKGPEMSSKSRSGNAEESSLLRRIRGRLGRHAAALAGDRRGAVALTVALALVPLTVASGLAVDAGRYLVARSKLAQAADAAALAAGTESDPQAIERTVGRILDANFSEGFLGVQIDSVEVQQDPDTGRITLVTRAEMPTLVMGLAHIDTLSIETRTVVVRESAPLEVAMVLDVTGSMGCCGKIQALKSSANDLVDILFGTEEVSEDLRIGVVPFNARVNIGNDRRSWLTSAERSKSPWKGCVESRSTATRLTDAPPSVELFLRSESLAGNSTGKKGKKGKKKKKKKKVKLPPCPPRLLPLTDTRAEAKAMINQLGASGTTRIDMGIRWGWRVLSRRWEGLWGEPERQPFEDVVTALIVMTDGQNVASSYDEVSASQADANVRTLCDRVKQEGILIYTITFKAPQKADALMQSCATSPGHYFRSPTAADLRDAFHTIAGELSALRIAE